MVTEVGERAGDGGRPKAGTLQLPGPADTGYTERMGGKLVAGEGEAVPGNAVQYKFPPVLSPFLPVGGPP